MTRIDLLKLAYFQPTRIFLTAAELGLFPLLNRPMATLEVAKERELNPEATGRLLNALTALGILVENEGKYSIPDDLKKELGDGPSSLLPMILHRARMWTMWSSLNDVVRTGKTHYELNEPDFDRSRYLPDFTRAMAVSGMGIAAETVSVLDLEGVGSVLDIGGGPGIYAAEFAKAIPDARVRVLDMPCMNKVAGEFIDTDRIRYIEGDALEILDADVIGEDGSDKFDIVFSSNLIHAMGPDEVRLLYKRCVNWCKPGGQVIVKDFFLDDNRTGPTRAAVFDINMLVATAAGRNYTWTETEDFLKSIQDESGHHLVTETRRIPLGDGCSGIIAAKVLI